MTIRPPTMQIAEQVVLITGASQGIGLACAREFARRGARLALTARSAEMLEAAARPGDISFAGDLLDAGFREQLVTRTLDHFGRLDILVNNAGVGSYSPVTTAPASEARYLFELNFFAPLDLAQRAAAVMKEQRRGTIVNVSSIAGQLTLPWMTLYSATKAAMLSLTYGLDAELKPYGARAIAVCPGYVRTQFQQHVLAGRPPDPVGRAKRFAVTPEQCARAIAHGVEHGRRRVVTPWTGGLAVSFFRLFPQLLEGRK